MKRLRAAPVAVAATLLAASLAHAGGSVHSCQKIVHRAAGAVSALSKGSGSVVRAEVGILTTKAKKTTITKELDAGDYLAFAVTDQTQINGLELGILDSSGKDVVGKTEAVDEAFKDKIAIAAKGTYKVELEATAFGDGVKEGHYILVLMSKSGGYVTDPVWENVENQVKSMEAEGYELVSGEFDMLSAPWALKKKLDAGSYRVDAVADEDRAKDLDLELKDGGSSVGKDDRKDHIASAKGDVKSGDATIALSGSWQEGQKDTFVGLLVGKKK
jgi:hypothetical protein